MNFFWNYADTYGSLIPLVTAFVIFYKKKYPDYCIPLVWYFILSIIIFGFSNYLADRRINNLVLYNIFSVIELIILTCFFRKIIFLKKGKDIPSFILLSFCIFSILNLFFLENYASMNSNLIAIEFLILIVYCFTYFIELSKTDRIIFFFKEPVFWIISGFFVYFSSCIIVFVLYKYASITNQSFIQDFWSFQIIMYIIKNLLIAKGILCFRTNK
jgi:hypothetical protein